MNFCGKVCLNLRIVKNLHAFALQTLAMTILVKFILNKATFFEKRVKLNFLKKSSILLKSA